MKLTFQTYGNEKQKLCFTYLLQHPEITEVWYGGAAWGWKSYTWVAWQWMMRNKYPWTRWFFWRNELKRLKQTTLATYFKFLDDYKIPQTQRGVYNSQDSVIKFANGSEILLLDLAYQPSDPLYTRFGSLELTDWFIDESAEVDEKCITIINTRIWRQRNEEYNLSPKLLEGFNPDKTHVYRRYYKPYTKGTLEAYRVFIPALATDNKKLPKSYIEQLGKADEVTKQRLLYWNFEYDDTKGRLFSYDAINDLWTNARQLGKKYVTCDPAREWKDKAVIMLWEWLHVREVITFDKCLATDIQNEIKRLQVLHEFGMSDVIIDSDWMWWPIVDNLECRGFANNLTALSPYNSKWRPDLKKNFKNLKTQCYFILADYVNKNKISIEPNYFKEDLIQELDVVVDTTTLDDNKKSIISKEDIKEKIGRSPDYSDALMMRMWFELQNQDWEAWTDTGGSNVYVQKWNLLLDNLLPEELEFNIVSEPTLNPYDEDFNEWN